MNCDSIAKQLEYDESNSDSSFEFNFDDDIQDPDYTIFEKDDLGGILAFDSDPDDNFEPLSTTPSGSINIISKSSEDEQPTSIRIGKKRIHDKSNWKRNITKKCRSEGIGHNSLRDKIVPHRTTGPDCHCKQECFTNISDDQKINLLVTFKNISDKNKHFWVDYLGSTLLFVK